MRVLPKLPSRRLMVVVAAAAGIALSVGITSRVLSWAAERRARQAFDNLTSSSLARIAELAVMEYRYTDVMELNRKFFVGGSSTSLVRFSGVVRAGISDVSRIRASYDVDEALITVTVPRSEILENTVDVTTLKIWDIKKNIFVPISTEVKLQEIGLFKERVSSELADSGFLSDATMRSHELIASLYAGFGAKVECDTPRGETAPDGSDASPWESISQNP